LISAPRFNEWLPLPDDQRSGEKKIPRRSGERDQVLHHSSFRLRDKAQLALSWR
jgi:hypothetical protein